jgi:hypothetical protein
LLQVVAVVVKVVVEQVVIYLQQVIPLLSEHTLLQLVVVELEMLMVMLLEAMVAIVFLEQ